MTTGYPRSYPVHDQRFATSRPDVLVYETEPVRKISLSPARSAPHCMSPHGHGLGLGIKLIDVYAGDYPDPKPIPRTWRWADTSNSCAAMFSEEDFATVSKN
jgi:hypothetical protein